MIRIGYQYRNRGLDGEDGSDGLNGMGVGAPGSFGADAPDGPTGIRPPQPPPAANGADFTDPPAILTPAASDGPNGVDGVRGKSSITASFTSIDASLVGATYTATVNPVSPTLVIVYGNDIVTIGLTPFSSYKNIICSPITITSPAPFKVGMAVL